MTTQKEKTPLAEVPKEIIPVENKLVKTNADVDGFIAKRQEFIQKVNAICVEGKDYHIIQGRKSLAKGGAEKIASIFHWTAKFEKDNEALEMIGDIKGWVVFKCTLVNGEFVGEGRGAANLVKNGGDLNKTLKMAQKSAFIDAVLRASGLSDFYTQDLGPEDEGATYGHLNKQEYKNNWQNNNRRQFQQEHGYSQTTYYRFEGMRDEALKRDNNSCVVCGMADNEHRVKWDKPITVDHINKNEKDNRLENLQTLCLTCHGRKDISPELIEPKIVEHKSEIKLMRASGMTYEAIAEKTGFSPMGIWKNVQKWISEEDMPKDQISTPTSQSGVSGGVSKQPTERQKAFIKQLCQQKKITQNQLKDFAITYKGNPGGLIDFLLKYQSTGQDEGTYAEHYNQDVKGEVPTIQQGADLSPEDQNLVDGVPF